MAIIGCSKLKLCGQYEAQFLYSKSVLFKKTLEYCKSQNFDKIMILSAKYGIINLDELITNYDETLKDKTESSQLNWIENVISKLKKINIKKLYFYCGNAYIRPIYKSLLKNNFIVYEPLKGLGIGKRIQYLTIK